MIHFYVGKPRNGKSLRVMMKIIEVLTKTQQHVVTNMVVRLDVLQEYLDVHGHDIHVLDRVTLLNDEETRDFWLFRGSGYVLPKPDHYDGKDADNVSYAPLFEDPRWRIGGKLLNADGSPTNFKGTCYVIDECQNVWPARGWQGTGQHIAFYLSQHGKLGDTVFFVTQNVKNVDRMLYSVAQDFTYCRNHRIEKHGRFRGDNKFTAKTYPGPVQNGNEITLNVEDYPLDLEIAACYDTSAGVGMPGGGTADAGFRAKGVPLKMVWVGLGAVLLLCFCVIKWAVPAFTERYLAPAIDPAHSTTVRKTAAGVQPHDKPQAPAMAPVDDRPEVPALTGVWSEIRKGRIVVHAYLEDGSRIPPQWITAYNLDDAPAGWVEAKGVRYYFACSKNQS